MAHEGMAREVDATLDDEVNYIFCRAMLANVGDRTSMFSHNRKEYSSVINDKCSHYGYGTIVGDFYLMQLNYLMA